MRIYVSHGARLSTKGDDVTWFVVEPQKDPERLEAELESLRRIGRTVVTIDVEPRAGNHYHQEPALAPAVYVYSRWENFNDSYDHYRDKVGLGRIQAFRRALRYELWGRDG